MAITKLYKYHTAILRMSDKTFHLYISDFGLDVPIDAYTTDAVHDGVIKLQQEFEKYVKNNPLANILPKSLFDHIQHTKLYLRINGEPIEAYLTNFISELTYTWE